MLERKYHWKHQWIIKNRVDTSSINQQYFLDLSPENKNMWETDNSKSYILACKTADYREKGLNFRARLSRTREIVHTMFSVSLKSIYMAFMFCPLIVLCFSHIHYKPKEVHTTRSTLKFSYEPKLLILGIAGIIAGSIILLVSTLYVKTKGGKEHYLKVVTDEKFEKYSEKALQIIKWMIISIIILGLFVIMTSRVIYLNQHTNINKIIENIGTMLGFTLGTIGVVLAIIIAFNSSSKNYYIVEDQNTILEHYQLKLFIDVVIFATFAVCLAFSCQYFFDNENLILFVFSSAVSAFCFMFFSAFFIIKRTIGIMFNTKRKELKYLNYIKYDVYHPTTLISNNMSGIKINIDYFVNDYIDKSKKFTDFLSKKQYNISDIEFGDNYEYSEGHRLMTAIKFYFTFPFFFLYTFPYLYAITPETSNINDLVKILIAIIISTIIGLFLNIIYAKFIPKCRIVMAQCSQLGWSYHIGKEAFFSVDNGKKAARSWISSLMCLVSLYEKISVTDLKNKEKRALFSYAFKNMKLDDENSEYMHDMMYVAELLLQYSIYKHSDNNEKLLIFNEYNSTNPANKTAKNMVFSIERNIENKEFVAKDFDKMIELLSNFEFSNNHPEQTT